MKTTLTITMGGLLAIAPCYLGQISPAIAQTTPKPVREITVPSTNFFPQTGNQIVVPTTNLFPDRSKPAAIAMPSDSVAPIQYTEETAPKNLEFTADQTPANLTALERPMSRLFGFETAYTLKQSEFIFRLSGISYNTPNDFRLFESPGSEQNRSNDTNIGVSYGITDNIQISFQQAGKDDTQFANLVRANSTLQFFYGSTAGQIKWKYYDNESIKAAFVVGAEFASPVPTLFNRGSHTITYATPGPRTVSDGGSGNEFRATDTSIYFSLGFPVAYQATEALSFHLNPQVSFFPSSIPASTTAGSTSALIADRVGFNGNSLDYYGTVVGLGFGVNYKLNSRLQFAADVTPILAGRNSAGVSDNSLFVTRTVWNAGIQFAPNNRTALSVFASNRFGPSPSAASNLLVQPNGDVGYGIELTYLPDFSGNYKITRRESYSAPSTFLSYLNGLPSTTLPVYSTLYQLSFGSNGRVNPSVRFGLLDDFELAVSFTNNDTNRLPLELVALGRLALLQDDGQTNSFASTLGLGITNLYVSNANLITLYLDIPTSFRVNSSLTLTATPKFIVPAQFAGLKNILGLSLGGIYNITDTTQIMAEYTPIFSGSNQLINTGTADIISVPPYSGKTGIFNIGLRQLFPSGSSLYAVDLYFTNSSADQGLQGISALTDGGKQVGIRFSILNGVPSK